MPGNNNALTKKNNRAVIATNAVVSKKKKGLTFRNNVNVRNILYTRKNGVNEYNRSVINSKAPTRIANGPGNYLHTRKSNLSVSPEWGVGESYYTAHGMMRARNDYLQLKDLFEDKWDDAEIVLSDHPELNTGLALELDKLKAQHKQQLESLAERLLAADELPSEEIQKLYKKKIDAAFENEALGRINAFTRIQKVTELEFNRDDALAEVKPSAELAWRNKKRILKKAYEKTKNATIRDFKERVLAMIPIRENRVNR